MRRPIIMLISLFWIALSASAAGADDIQTSQAHPADMIVTTTSILDGYRIKEYKGVVRGITVRQPTIGQGLSASLERLKGGHISAYAAMCETARKQAYDACIDRARELGANAILAMRYDSSGFEHGNNVNTEVICYGTAVTIERDARAQTGDRKIAAVVDDEPETTDLRAENTPIKNQEREPKSNRAR